MVFNNNLKGAMSLISEKAKGGVLPLNTTTMQGMKAKHPNSKPALHEALLSGEMPPDPHDIFFAAIDGDLIKRCTLRTKGAAGVSQQEDSLWHKMTTSFRETSSGLCNAVAALARRLASEFVDPAGLESFLANRGIAIDKCPGLRPVGVGEMLRRIVGKAIMIVTSDEVQSAVGALQLCAGQPSGVEAAIHGMKKFLDQDGILMLIMPLIVSIVPLPCGMFSTFAL